jgi:TonB-dependent starch-binding outer membrane protein SusC
MKLTFTNKTILIKTLRHSLLQMILIVMTISLTMANDSKSQGILDKSVTVNGENEKITKLLSIIEKQAEVKFVYSNKTIKNQDRSTINRSNERLELILMELLIPLEIGYEVKDKIIILNKVESTRNNQKSISSLGTQGILIKSNNLISFPIRGKVTDTKGDAMIGATVIIAGTTIGTTTDLDGNYSLDVDDKYKNGSIEISYVGYEKVIVPIDGKNVINASIKSATSLSEVVVIGYGEQIKRNITSAISNIKGEELRQLNVAGIDNALQGRAAGVQVIRNTGAPGGGVSIRIRGTASLLGGQEPLYIVDGVPINNTPTGSNDVFNTNRNGGVAGNEFVNPISQIPVDDIESIEVLKDAASASIYGARAANGVVLITTKRGQAGKLEVNLSAYTGYGEVDPSRRYDLLNGPEFAAASNLARRIRNLPITYPDSLNVNDVDYQSEIFRRAPMGNISLSVNGGSDKAKYNVSGSLFDQKGTIIGTDFSRGSFRSALDFIASKRLKIGTNLMYTKSTGSRLRNTGNGAGTDNFNNNNLFGPSVLAAALITNPTFKPFKDGGIYQTDTLNPNISPVATALELKLKNYDDRLIGNVFGDFEIIKGLKLWSKFGIDVRNSFEDYFTPLISGVYGGGATGASLENGYYRENLWLTENYLTYDLKRVKHSANFLLGFSAQESKSNGISIRVRNIPSNDLQIISAGPQLLAIKEQGYQFWGIASQFGRINYSYDSKYLFSATVRRDGSSRFGPNKRWGVFPSASVGWVISDENFFKSLPVLSFAKIRASYGVTGNDQVGDVWTWRASIRPLESATGGYLGASGARPVSIEDGNFSWEETKQLDLGLEVGFKKDRFLLNVDYYNRLTDGLLYNIQLPATSGFTTALNNLGSIENRGIEASLSSTNVRTKDFIWKTDFNISFNKNKLLSLYEGKTQDIFGSTIIRVNDPISFFGLIIDGINPKTGDFNPRDLNADGVINDLDMTIIGSPLPKHFGGFNNNIQYKNFDLGIFSTWSYGNSIMNTTRSLLEQVRIPANGVVISNMLREAYVNRWTTVDQPALHRGFDPANAYRATGGRSSDWNLEDGSYIRIRALSLGYNLPKSLISKLKIRDTRIYLNANNPFLFTKYTGYDPEVNHNNIGTNITIGYDNGTYPNSRSFVFGFNLGV